MDVRFCFLIGPTYAWVQYMDGVEAFELNFLPSISIL